MINLLIQVYEKKDLCSKLLTEFNKTYDKPDQKNNIITHNLENFNDKFNDICENSENIISDIL